MPDLIKVYDSDGKEIGKCGYSCYAATKPECNCICGGKNHGIGFKAAMAQAAEITEAIIKKAEDGTDVRNEAKDLKLIECQGTELDEDLESHFFKKVCVLPDKKGLMDITWQTGRPDVSCHCFIDLGDHVELAWWGEGTFDGAWFERAPRSCTFADIIESAKVKRWIQAETISTLLEKK